MTTSQSVEYRGIRYSSHTQAHARNQFIHSHTGTTQRLSRSSAIWPATHLFQCLARPLIPIGPAFGTAGLISLFKWTCSTRRWTGATPAVVIFVTTAALCLLPCEYLKNKTSPGMWMALSRASTVACMISVFGFACKTFLPGTYWSPIRYWTIDTLSCLWTTEQFSLNLKNKKRVDGHQTFPSFVTKCYERAYNRYPLYLIQIRAMVCTLGGHVDGDRYPPHNIPSQIYPNLLPNLPKLRAASTLFIP